MQSIYIMRCNGDLSIKHHIYLFPFLTSLWLSLCLSAGLSDNMDKALQGQWSGGNGRRQAAQQSHQETRSESHPLSHLRSFDATLGCGTVHACVARLQCLCICNEKE